MPLRGFSVRAAQSGRTLVDMRARYWIQMAPERTLQELVDGMRSADPHEARAAEAELYGCTVRFVCLVVREARGAAWRTHASTDWLANAAEKSFLSYVRKTQWEAGLPADKTLLAMLRTITRRVVMREIDKLVNRPRASGHDFDQLLEQLTTPPTHDARPADFRDFMHHLLDHLARTDEESVRVLELALEGHTRTEIGEMLNIGRGRMHRLMMDLRRRVLLCLLDQDQPEAARTFRLNEAGASRAEIAEQTGLSLDEVERSISMVSQWLGRQP